MVRVVKQGSEVKAKTVDTNSMSITIDLGTCNVYQF
jgi:hypothetical protein